MVEPVAVGKRKEENMRFRLKLKKVFTKSDLDKITEATRKAELLTSGEIKVVIRDACKKNLSTKEQALADFIAYGLGNTRDKTGVLILLVMKERQIEVLGDKGINDLVPEGYWDNIITVIRHGFDLHHPREGICEAVGLIGEKLQEIFPRKLDDINELSNEPIIAH